MKTYTYKNLEWVDADSPTTDDITLLVKKYNLHPLLGEELFVPTRKSKVDVYKDYIYVVLHIPLRLHDGSQRRIEEKEIDFIIGTNFIITTHNGIIEPLHRFAKAFEVDSIVDKKGIGDHAGTIFYFILKRLYENMLDDLENIKDSLNNAENEIFSGNERIMVQVLSELSMEIIDFKQSARLHAEVLTSFSSVPDTFFGKNFQVHVDDIRNIYAGIHDLIAVNRELLADLRETNDSLLSTKQNENMRFFSILAFVTFPLTLLVALFTIPSSHTPIIGMQYDWEIIAGSVVVLAILMFSYFKKKGWL